MKKSLSLILIFVSVNLFALECNEDSFNKGNDEMKQIYTLYNKTSVTQKEHKALSTSKISKKNYSSDMKILEDTLSSLNIKTSNIFLASMVNDDNINTWKALEETCEGRYLSTVQQAKQDAEKMKKAINQRMSTINKHASRTKLVIKVGKDKYSN